MGAGAALSGVELLRPHMFPRAYVLGDMDLVRPLGLAGIRSVVVTA